MGSNPTASAKEQKDRAAVFLRVKNQNAGLENLNERTERGVIRGLRGVIRGLRGVIRGLREQNVYLHEKLRFLGSTSCIFLHIMGNGVWSD